MSTYTIHFSLTFFMAFVFAVGCTYLVKRAAVALHIVDAPDKPRKIHSTPVPLLGGTALFLALLATLGCIAMLGWLTDYRIPTMLIYGLGLSGLCIIIGGALDDAYSLSWWQQVLFPLAAIVIILIAGLRMSYITNPLTGGLLSLDETITGVPVGTIFVFVWLLGMMYTTKLLDGIDGLTTSISMVASLVIFIVSLFWDRSGSTTSFIAIALAGSALGFLVWNWHPAKIFLGEGGSVFLGFMLGVLAIISGGKIATALLVMGVPILDVAWIILRRLRSGKSIFSGDAQHLHFRLLHAGMSQRSVVVFLSGVGLIFGSASFFFTTQGKLIALATLLLFMIVLATILVHVYEKNTSSR